MDPLHPNTLLMAMNLWDRRYYEVYRINGFPVALWQVSPKGFLCQIRGLEVEVIILPRHG
jgi:hypothetical protein